MITESQRSLLRWLSQEEFSQYGECYGDDLNALLEAGFAQVHDEPEKQAGFIVRGRSLMHRAVSITEAGRAALGWIA